MPTPRLIALTFLAIATLTLAACGGSDDSDPAPTPTASSQPPTAAASAAPTEPGRVAQPPQTDAYALADPIAGLDFGIVTGMYPVPGDDGYAWVLEKSGQIWRARTAGGVPPDLVLDMESRLIEDPGTEEGLLGLAFAPDFEATGRFYVSYSQGGPRRNTVSRLVATGNTADVTTEEILLEVEDPYPNHNGGGLAFGPDGMLYIGFGDGGAAGDPNANGQNTNVLLGKLLRIDVSGPRGFAIPADNPFAASGAPEIFAYGLRNPWRFDFGDDGRLWLADVGQGELEEVNIIERGGNYGWDIMEGTACYDAATCDETGLILPVAEYTHDEGGCSITGGYVYGGSSMPELHGWYVYGDFCSGIIWALNTADPSQVVRLAQTEASITAFGEDHAGEVYILQLSGAPQQLARAQF